MLQQDAKKTAAAPLTLKAAMLAALMASNSAQAWHDRPHRDRVVLGVEVGSAEQQIEQSDFPGADIDNTDTGFKFYGGFRSGELLSYHLGYVDFGEVSIRDGATFAEADSGGAFVDIGLNLPLAPGFSLYGKAGLIAWQQDTRDNTLGFVDYHHEQGVDPFWGIGMRLQTADNLALKFAFDRYEFKDDGSNVIEDYELATVGLELLF